MGATGPAAVWANMGSPSYYVSVPAGREWVYEWAAPAFLTLAALAAGWWLIRARSVRTGGARGPLWVVGGCLAVSYSAAWLWAHRDDQIPSPSWADWAAVTMPWLWAGACCLVAVAGWRRVHPPDPPKPAPLSEGGRNLPA